MADQFNDSIPAVTNQITEDVADIAETLGYLKDCFQKILGGTWSNTSTDGFKFFSGLCFNDGTYNTYFPTNNTATARFMLGDTNTISWFYVNTAPPGWKALTTGADTIIAISGGAASYNVNGGNPDSSATWTITGLAADAHTHTGPSHTHTGTTNTGLNWASDRVSGDSGGAVSIQHDHAFSTAAGGTGNSGAASATGVTHTPGWRPKASIGKLFQLDTA